MKLKYAPGEIPLLNEHHGTTFMPSIPGQSALQGQRNDRHRYPAQWLRMQNNQKAVRYWREMSAGTKAAWNSFATTFPQPSKANPDIFLTGYQCFIKRNSFCFLNHGIASDFMLEPDVVISESESINFRIRQGNSVIDCTELYIARFGILPKVGQTLFLYASIYSEYSGHFYESIRTVVNVEEVYVDGLFCEVIVPESFHNVTISVYLSMPVSPGRKYHNSNCRYMGCFTVKKFSELQDVPVPTPEQDGWVWTWSESEQMWILAPASGGNNAFNPIASSGQPTITADSSTTQLNIAGSNGISISQNNVSKTITISGTSTFNIRGQVNQNNANHTFWHVSVPFPPSTSIYMLRKFVLAGHYDGQSFVIEGYVIRTDIVPNYDIIIVKDTLGLGVTFTVGANSVDVKGNDPASGNTFRQAMHYYYSGDFQ
jgi:hypothetical protein